jgi:phosphoribosyl-dephospho-CoA transferase
MKKKIDKKNTDKELEELIEVAKSAVVGYEKYLLDKINYNDLARIMTNLREHLPFGVTGANKK